MIPRLCIFSQNGFFTLNCIRLFLELHFSRNHFPYFQCLVTLKKVDKGDNVFRSKKKLTFKKRMCFSFVLYGKHFPKPFFKKKQGEITKHYLIFFYYYLFYLK